MNDVEITDELISEWRECFSLFDKDCSGNINAKDLGVVMRSLGMNPSNKDIEEYVEKYQTEDKKIPDTQFIAIMSEQMKNTLTEEHLRNAFKVFDKNGDGVIDMKELKIALTTMGEKLTDEEVEELFQNVDTDHDGTISYEEFIKMVTGW